MQRRRRAHLERGEMARRRVTLVSGKIKPRIVRVHALHQGVAEYLGENRCGADGIDRRISPDHGLNRAAGKNIRLPAPPPAGLSLPQRPPLRTTATTECVIRRCAQDKETKPAEGLRPWRAQGVSPVFRAALVQTGLRPPFPFRYRSSSRVGDTPLLALAAPAGVGQGQGVFVSKHSKAIQKRRNHP